MQIEKSEKLIIQANKGSLTINRILITGVAEFTGSHLVERLLKEGYKVMGIDNLNDYYDVNLLFFKPLEQAMAKKLKKYDGHTSRRCETYLGKHKQIGSSNKSQTPNG